MPADAQQSSDLLCACPDVDWDIKPQASEVTLAIHQFNVDKVAEADMAKGYELVFFGDSITQHMRENSNWPVFDKYFASKYRAYPLGVGNDQINNLNWRLRNGELPHTTPRVAIMLIGTNDVGAVEGCTRNEADLLSAVPIINTRMRALLAYMRANSPGMHIVVLGVLSRGAWSLPDQYAWPNRLTKSLAAINAASAALAETDSHIHYVDCSAGLTNATGIDRSILPDSLHPNAAGYEKIFACLSPLVDRLMQPTAATVSAQACPSVADAKAAGAALLAGGNATGATVTAHAPASAPAPAAKTFAEADLVLPGLDGAEYAGDGLPVWRNVERERRATAAAQARTEAVAAPARRAFAEASDEHGALILARQPRTTDNTCQTAPVAQTSAAAVAFAARVADTQRANANVPGGCYLDC
ncbi:hypothetical protein WJX81_006254 [Elliptochloris bilobata]|uniref:SGNH hydrolase-type esterase domain-containing protein n=1 Tax=Elliptochloris bilobata TaxID=381761 RepID=A0AAW1RYW2_9CHLO